MFLLIILSGGYLSLNALPSRVPSSAVVQHGQHLAHAQQRIPRAYAVMKDAPRDDGGILETLKRRGDQLAREIVDTAERMGDLLDESLDAVLGPRASPNPGLIPIPIPVDRHPGGYDGGYGGYRDRY